MRKLTTHIKSTTVYTFSELNKKAQERVINDRFNTDWYIQDMSEQATEYANTRLAEEFEGVTITGWNDRHGQLVDFEFEKDGQRVNMYHDEEYDEVDQWIEVAGEAIFAVINPSEDEIYSELVDDDQEYFYTGAPYNGRITVVAE